MRDIKTKLLAAGAALILSGCAAQTPLHVTDDARYDAITSESLTPFKSEADYENWRRQSKQLEAQRRKTLQEAQQALAKARAKTKNQGGQNSDNSVVEDDVIVATASKSVPAPNITNVQNIGVDEGDIVKQVGGHLVLMQDGRLFSLNIESHTPTLAARVNIYDTADEGIWYDELLVSGRRLVVTGYHYDKDATEITVFDLDTNGQFSRQGTWYLESEDYYSGDNSATRMIGDTLIFHTQGDIEDPDDWPALRQKNKEQTQPILNARDIHPPVLRLSDPSLHIVTECKLAQNLDCKSRAVMAPRRAEWIVTENDGYLWVGAPRPDWYITRYFGSQKHKQPNTLYRFPLGTDKVEAVTLNARLGSRFAFEAQDDRILALVSQDAPKQGRGQEEARLALLDIPMSDFSQRPTHIPSVNYSPLPGEQFYRINVRYTADHLVYSNYLEYNNVAYVVDLNTRLASGPIAVPHDVDRLDRVGSNAVLIGEGKDDLSLSWLDLSSAPTLTDTMNLANRFEAEGRAQALNMRVDTNGSALLGLPTYFEGAGRRNYDEEDGTDISFARVSSFGQITDLGPAQGDPSRVSPDYVCETSCVDWYGNARPFFIGERIFALIASELIELQETSNGLIERSRVNLSAPL